MRTGRVDRCVPSRCTIRPERGRTCCQMQKVLRGSFIVASLISWSSHSITSSARESLSSNLVFGTVTPADVA